MTYKEYIDLGFKRTDCNDKVEFNNTGYEGFVLTKKINNRMSIEVCSGELDSPKLYIQKGDSDFYHRIKIDPKVIQDMFYEN